LEKLVKFMRMDEDLYVFKPKMKQATKTKVKIFFYLLPIQKTKKAKELYQGLRIPSIQNFKSIIRMNMVANNPIITKDFDIFHQIFGPNIKFSEGKTTTKKQNQLLMIASTFLKNQLQHNNPLFYTSMV
jgi:hypothetical protein